jgi:hypothetical protein
MVRLISVSALVLACTLAAGCADDNAPGPVPEPPPQINETLTGTLELKAAVTHLFTTDQTGQATVTLTSLSPDSAARVSFMFGTWNGSHCIVPLSVKDDATTGTSFNANASGPGVFCVRIADIGNLTEPTTYTISVTHF